MAKTTPEVKPKSETPAVVEETVEERKARLDPRNKVKVTVDADPADLVDLDNLVSSGRQLDKYTITEATPKRTYLDQRTGTLHEDR